MKQIVLYNSALHETIAVEITDAMFDNLENTVLIKDYETFNLVSTIPDDVKLLRKLEQEFEDNEFETIYKELPTEGVDPKAIDAKFVEYFYKCVKEKYPVFNELSDEKKTSVCLVLCTRFSIFVFSKQKKDNEKLEINTDLTFGEEYAKRIINLFNSLSLDDPDSIQNFSIELEKVEQDMLNDPRRRAGFDTLMLGLSTSIQDIASVFINDPNADSINLVEAFKNGVNNKDKASLKEKLTSVIKSSTVYYDNYLTSLNNAIATINKVDSHKSIGYLKVACKMICDFVTDTQDYVNEMANLRGHSNVDDIRQNRIDGYKKVIGTFSYSLDMLMTAFDHEKIEEDEYGKKVVSAWRLYEKEKSSDNEAWYFTLAKAYIAGYNELFDCLKVTNTEKK